MLHLLSLSKCETSDSSVGNCLWCALLRNHLIIVVKFELVLAKVMSHWVCPQCEPKVGIHTVTATQLRELKQSTKVVSAVT